MASTGQHAPSPRPPGTLRADARRNRAKVLRAAEAAFAAEGLSVPLDEIARQAGVGAGTVYRHFPTKEALFEAVVHDRLQELADDARMLASSDRADTALFGFIDRLLREAAPKRDLVDALDQAGVNITDALTEVAAELRDGLDQLLVQAQRAGAVRHDLGVGELMALLSGLMAATHHAGATIAPDRAAAILCDGLRASAARQPPA